MIKQAINPAPWMHPNIVKKITPTLLLEKNKLEYNFGSSSVRQKNNTALEKVAKKIKLKYVIILLSSVLLTLLLRSISHFFILKSLLLPNATVNPVIASTKWTKGQIVAIVLGTVFGTVFGLVKGNKQRQRLLQELNGDEELRTFLQKSKSKTKKKQKQQLGSSSPKSIENELNEIDSIGIKKIEEILARNNRTDYNIKTEAEGNVKKISQINGEKTSVSDIVEKIPASAINVMSETKSQQEPDKPELMNDAGLVEQPVKNSISIIEETNTTNNESLSSNFTLNIKDSMSFYTNETIDVNGNPDEYVNATTSTDETENTRLLAMAFFQAKREKDRETAELLQQVLPKNVTDEDKNASVVYKSFKRRNESF